jgi:hypothetical protein
VTNTALAILTILPDSAALQKATVEQFVALANGVQSHHSIAENLRLLRDTCGQS